VAGFDLRSRLALAAGRQIARAERLLEVVQAARLEERLDGALIDAAA